MKIIPRTTYLDELSEIINIPDIKIITGVRRSGKSKLMDALVQIIKENDPKLSLQSLVPSHFI